MSKKTKNRALRRRALQAVKASAPVTAAFHTAAAALSIEASQAAEGETPRRPTISADAYNGGPMTIRGYKHPVVVDVAGVTGFGHSLPVLRGHDENKIVGHGTAEAAEGRIRLSGSVSAENDHANEVTTLAANGFPWQASIGLMPSKVEDIRAGKTANVNGQQITGPAHVVRAGRLYEVSIVPLGADSTTAAAVAASLESDDSDHTGADDDMEPVHANTDPADNIQTSGQLAGIKAERQRRSQLEAIAVDFAKRGGDLDTIEAELQTAIEAGETPTQFELRLLRKTRPAGIDSTAGRDTVNDGLLIEAGIALHCGGEVAKEYSPELLQRAEDKFGGGLKLGQVLRIAAKRNGYTTMSETFGRSLLQAAFAPVQARGASTYDLSGVLSNVANKAIRAGFMAVDNSWRQIASIGSARDFKQVTRYALTGDFKFEKVGNGGELKNATMGEESYTNQADTYGKLFAITRQDFINDDLSAFDRVRGLIGRGAALQFNTIFWTEFLADISTFWTTGRANYFEGAATNLQSSSLQTAEQMLMEQTDPNGNLLGATGELLLVPPSLYRTAKELYESSTVNTGGSSTKDRVPSANTFQGAYRPVVSPYVGTKGGITNASDTHWFLLANPSDVPVIDVLFLNGRQQPTVEAADADFDILGVQMRGYFDFGVNKQEYRGGVRSKGAA